MRIKTQSGNRAKIRNRVIAVAVIAAAVILGCLVSGDGPIRFIVRLFTLDYVPELEAGAGIASVALFGFLTSFHCIGMCGGVILSQCAGRERGGAGWQGLKYNAGRVVSYTLAGLLAGALGSLISLNGHLKALVPLLCAAVMLVMGLNLLGLLRWLGLGRASEVGFLKKLKGCGAFAVGFATGFMPCGMLQIAQLHALGSGSALYGALSMLVFALTSTPVLLAFGTLAGALTVKNRNIAMKAAAVIVLIMGVKMLIKALGLMGVV
jgi:sulfite exporter TauE/SafE